MKRRLTAVLATVGAASALLTTSLAHAQQKPEFGEKGEIILSADRLFPLVSFSSVSQDSLTPIGGTTRTTTTTQTGISLLWGSTSTPGTNGANGPGTTPETLFFTIPRVGFDYVVVPNFTLGGDIALFFTLGGHVKTEVDNNNGTSQTNSVGSPSNTVFGIAPRAGYILGLNNVFSLWLRGGLSFYTESQKLTTVDNNGNTIATGTDSDHQFALDLDPQLVISPIQHVGFTVGLTWDIPLAGGHSTETVENNNTQTNSAGASIWFLGVTAGMLVYF